MRRRAVIAFPVVLLLLTLAGSAWAGPNIWTATGPDGGSIRAVLVDPASPSTIYVGTARKRRVQEHRRWRKLGAEPTLPARWRRARCDRSCLAPGARSTLAPTTPSTRTNGVFQSTDGGGTWTPLPAQPANKKVQALAWDGVNLYAGTRERGARPFTGGVFKWNGSTWTLPRRPMACRTSPRAACRRWPSTRAPARPVVYAGTQGEGVFKSIDSGATWSA